MANEKIEKGGISVETAQIFPIIKKWLYSDKDIFLREIVSNACDACTKLRRLSSLGEVDGIDNDFKITVTVSKEDKTISVTDNGIGMTEDELKRYICQIALSGALEFIEKYEGEGDASSGIIGHFGLGFYSAFMVSGTVDGITRSYTGAPAVKWVCTESGEYEMSESDETARGTSVVMHIAEGEEEYLEKDKLLSILKKYCSFMPVEIYFVDGDAEETEEKEENKPVNDVEPLWQKNASECSPEEYKEFYGKVFSDFKEPLFHIHINADYPLNFKGILYFPRITHEYESLEGEVKLYYNQVFVADNIKEVIPEYLTMLKGVLDCPELPLNVSRSYLQNNSYVSKLSAHIVKKVADKINGLYNTEREEYERIWGDLKTFVEYGCLRDRKFYDRVKGSILFKLSDGSHVTVDDYLEAAKEKHENTVYYATDAVSQAQYISMLSAQDIKVVIFDKIIDTQFINVIETDRAGVKFKRVDSGLADALKGDGQVLESEELKELFKKVSGNDKLTVSFESLKNDKVPAILTVSEESRRMEDMMRLYAMAGEGKDMPFAAEYSLILNSSNELIRRLSEDTASDKSEKLAKQLYSLALISQRQLSAAELEEFLNHSYDILADL
ncbi:MAG: molecular chaperone HtpG [Clostridia bacterium]|nr:molecular chaperone HtpG [Clostridia bacterium]